MTTWRTSAPTSAMTRRTAGRKAPQVCAETSCARGCGDSLHARVMQSTRFKGPLADGALPQQHLIASQRRVPAPVSEELWSVMPCRGSRAGEDEDEPDGAGRRNSSRKRAAVTAPAQRAVSKRQRDRRELEIEYEREPPLRQEQHL